MSKAKMQAARELIREKKYDEARNLLEAVDHPTATKWISKIDTLLAAQSDNKPIVDNLNKLSSRRKALRVVLLSTIAVLFLIPKLLPSLSPTQTQIDILATAAARIPNSHGGRFDDNDYYVSVEDSEIGLRHREKFAQIGRTIIVNNIEGIRRVILNYSVSGIITFTLTAKMSDIRAFVNGVISEDEFEVRIKVQ